MQKVKPAAGSSTDKSGPLSYTQNYVFNKADVLGKGATATVYLGRHRILGHVVAIKEFDKRQIRQVIAARKREIEVLRGIKHKNIMTLLDCEREAESGQEVMVMEYCSGGSVFTLLEQPQNMHGFQQDEFLKFMKDTCCGLKYLRSMNIIHRDIKPGNIMKKVDEDGKMVFVLTDFGAARELQDDETFMSIFGTEEYIHPNMYQRAVLHEPGHSTFDSSVDLWSLGVTLFHCACGHVPFKPYNGRQDAQTMFQITSGRQSGVISGIQNQPNGPIQWSKTLPETCHLSSSLRKLLEPVLAGIFEPDSRKLITFDTLFRRVEEIVSMATVNVYVLQTARQMQIFIPKHERYVHLQEAIARITDIPSQRQLILVSDKVLSSVIDINQQIQEYPKTVLKSQLFVFDKDGMDYVRYKHPLLVPFPTVAGGGSLSSDASVARRCTAASYFITAKVKDNLESQSLLRLAIRNLWTHIKGELVPAETSISLLDKLLVSSESRIQCLTMSQTNLTAISSILKVFDNKAKTSATDWTWVNDLDVEGIAEDFLKRAKTRVGEIRVYMSVLKEKMREQDILYSPSFQGCEDEDECLAKFQQFSQNLNAIYTTFLKHKKYHDLHQHEIFIHTVERQRLQDQCVKVVSLYQDHCNHALFNMHKAAVDYTGKLLKHLTRSEKVEANVKCVVDCHERMNVKLNKVDESLRRMTEVLKERAREIAMNHGKEDTLSHTTSQSRDSRESIAIQGGASVDTKTDYKTSMMRRIINEVENLKNESFELDVSLQENIDSIVELKRMLLETGLNSSSLGNESPESVSWHSAD